MQSRKSLGDPGLVDPEVCKIKTQETQFTKQVYLFKYLNHFINRVFIYDLGGLEG